MRCRKADTATGAIEKFSVGRSATVKWWSSPVIAGQGSPVTFYRLSLGSIF